MRISFTVYLTSLGLYFEPLSGIRLLSVWNSKLKALYFRCVHIHTHTHRPVPCFPLVDDGVVAKGSQKCYIVAIRVHQRQDFRRGKHDLFVISESGITYMVLYSIYLSVLSLSILCSVFFLFVFLSLLKLWNISLYSTRCTSRTENWRHPCRQKGTHASSWTSFSLHTASIRKNVFCFDFLPAVL